LDVLGASGDLTEVGEKVSGVETSDCLTYKLRRL
jgi:hypothetical protein